MKKLKQMDSAVEVELPEEMMIEEILPREEVKSLLRWKCVSKSWRSLIESEAFIDKHLCNSAKHRSGGRAIFNCSRCDGFRLRTPDGTYHPKTPGWYVVGHHDGLVCILGRKPGELKGRLFLCNLATRIHARLPDPELAFEEIKLGFGWDPHSGAYKVFMGVPDHDFYHDDEDEGGGGQGGRIARIYSSETNSWRAAEHGSDSSISEYGVCAGGKIYWLTRSGYIEYLDLKNEVFGKTMIDFPSKLKFEDEGVYFWLWESRGSLCIVCDTHDGTKRSVWVMEEENNWVEDEEVASKLGMEVCGLLGAFPYFETLISPPLLPSS